MEIQDEEAPAEEAVARLTIYSETSSAEELAVRVGLEPDEKWNKGDLDRRGRPITTTAISYQSSVRPDAAPPDRLPELALAELVERIEPLRERLIAERDAGSSVRLKLALFEDTDNVVFGLPADLLARLGSLGLGLEFDIYP